jgi:hypothetical protein
MEPYSPFFENGQYFYVDRQGNRHGPFRSNQHATEDASANNDRAGVGDTPEHIEELYGPGAEFYIDRSTREYVLVYTDANGVRQEARDSSSTGPNITRAQTDAQQTVAARRAAEQQQAAEANNQRVAAQNQYYNNLDQSQETQTSRLDQNQDATGGAWAHNNPAPAGVPQGAFDQDPLGAIMQFLGLDSDQAQTLLNQWEIENERNTRTYGVDALTVDYEQSQYANPQERDQFALGQERSAISALEDIYNSGGLTDADRQRLQASQMQIGQGMRSQREADAAALQARGMGGSGAEIASMLGAQQSGANASFSAMADVNTQAQQRALEAMTSAGQMAGSRAGAADQFNQWMTGHQQSWYDNNTNRRNATRESRVNARKSREDRNTQLTAMKTGKEYDDSDERGGLIDKALGIVGSTVQGITG